MSKKYHVLIMDASYGSLLAAKLGLAGHSAHLICLPAEADLINAEGAIVRALGEPLSAATVGVAGGSAVVAADGLATEAVGRLLDTV